MLKVFFFFFKDVYLTFIYLRFLAFKHFSRAYLLRFFGEMMTITPICCCSQTFFYKDESTELSIMTLDDIALRFPVT